MPGTELAPAMNLYIVYDARWYADSDRATVMEAFDAKDDETARKEARETWPNQRAVLVRMKRVGDCVEDDYVVETVP